MKKCMAVVVGAWPQVFAVLLQGDTESQQKSESNYSTATTDKSAISDEASWATSSSSSQNPRYSKYHYYKYCQFNNWVNYCI